MATEVEEKVCKEIGEREREEHRGKEEKWSGRESIY